MTNDALYFCLFLEIKHAQCGVIMVHDSEEAFVEMWVEERGNMRKSSAYSMQPSITITCLILNIA